MPSLKTMAKSAKAKKPSAPSKKPEKTIAPKKLSREFVQESDGEDDDSSASGDSESEDESLPENPANSIPKKKQQLPSPEGSSSSDETESESSSSSKEDEDTDESSESGDDPVETSRAPIVVPVPSGPYGIPPLFESATIHNAKETPGAFKKYKSEGKQIWYFTAPASVPISSITRMSLANVKNGEKVCAHNGNDYGFVQDAMNDGTDARILAPHGSDAYQAVPNPVDRIFHLQQLPKPHDDLKATVPAKKPVRPQPKGLKMRFVPLGYSDRKGRNTGVTEDSNEDPTHPKQFKKPTSIPSDSDEDSEATSDSDEEMTEAPPLPSEATAPRKQKSSKATSGKSTTNGSVKRKHSEVPEKKTKKSSSTPTPNPDSKQLKRPKIKQKKADKKRVG